jgi:hypothetical protein
MDEPQETKGNLNQLLTVIVILLIAGVFGAIYMPHFPAPDVHPPQVSIIRNDGYIDIRYLGGIDTAFVGNFTVTVNNVTTHYEKPDAGQLVAHIQAQPELTCVNVSAFDKAVQSYRPIGWGCV